MTLEEKAKAYDEALEKARKMLNMILDNELLGFPDQIREIFPQLRESESEDERIIKLIRSLLENVRNVQSNTSLYKQYDDALAWLEKQKEQKPLKVGENAYFDPNTEMWFIKKEQKPAELNEEFVERLMDCMCAAQQYRTGTISWDVVKGWAKELNELKKPAEWSEEDEKMLRTIISDGSRGVELDSKQISWLKSLRPSWKPSEEQMAALEAATVRYQSTGLESLYEELKKQV